MRKNKFLLFLLIILTGIYFYNNKDNFFISTNDYPNTSSNMIVHYIDVGQGDATLLMCDGEYMLLDTGDNNKGTLVQNYLQKRGIDHAINQYPIIDFVVSKFSKPHVIYDFFTPKEKAVKKLRWK